LNCCGLTFDFFMSLVDELRRYSSAAFKG
jgi:hypothetical protein